MTALQYKQKWERQPRQYMAAQAPAVRVRVYTFKKITLTVMLEGNSAVRTRAVIHGVQGRQRYFNQVSTPCLLLLFLNFQSMEHMLLGTSCHVVGKTCRGNSVK